MAALFAAAAYVMPAGPDHEWRAIEADATDFVTNRRHQATTADPTFRAEYGPVRTASWDDAFIAYITHTYPKMAAKYGGDIEGGGFQNGYIGSLLRVSAIIGRSHDLASIKGYIKSMRWSHEQAAKKDSRMAKEDPGMLVARWTAQAKGYKLDAVKSILWHCSPTRVGWEHRMKADTDRRPSPDVPAGVLRYALDRIPAPMLRAVYDRMKAELAKIPPAQMGVYRRVMAGETVAGFNDWGNEDFDEEHEAEEKLSLIPRIADIQEEVDRNTEHENATRSRLFDHIEQDYDRLGGFDIAEHVASFLSSNMVQLNLNPVTPRISRLELARELQQLSAQMVISTAASMPLAHVRSRMRRVLDMLDGQPDPEDGNASNKASKHY